INADNNEQEEGNMATNRQSEKEIKKKTKVPVLICIICALICVIAAILLLLLRYNVFSGFSSKEHERPVVTRIEPNQVLSSENEIPPPPVVSKVNEIVVPPTPQAVVPQVPVSTVQSSNDIIYRIKWGDTLWDISNAYYRNPWKYTRIARYNNIKNPDYIVSGTTIRIPAE
ncbi:MAG: LysM peptidoglycan-binding domain-containing protein, partial [Treponema sp.]|nr:LysM peptidoglycan-binding domain-containing protein [Treponema sp.]